MLRKLLGPVLILVVLGSAAGVAYASHDDGGGGSGGAKAARRATQQFRKLSVADKAGYKLLVDKDGIACIDMPGMGAMGVHYANVPLVLDGAIDPLKPEAVIYEPGEDGRMRLVALEYVVFQDAWDATHSARPSLFGHEFNFTPAGNRFDLPPYYSLHAWLFKDNPAGTFAPWNPDVTCSPDDDHGGHEGMEHMGSMDG